jgi:FkbM family methyltransferase
VTEHYEPEVWRHMMSEVRAGDCVADVGAFIGLYAVALAVRVGETGSVLAFEPDIDNYAVLAEHCRLNGVLDRVELIGAAVGDSDDWVSFEGGNGSESRVSGSGSHACVVQSVRLDSIFAERRLDILKVDVEGFEGAVLRGANGLLDDVDRRPRVIFIEMHPYAWSASGTSGAELLAFLRQRGYRVSDTSGVSLNDVTSYGEVVAYAECC